MRLGNFIANTQRVLKRLDRSLSGPIVEFSEQFLYGHREILICYAGLDAKSLIKGSVEHGWALDSGRGIKKLTGGRYLYLSWCKERVARSGVRDSTTIAIGAPFIYAHSMVQNEINLFEMQKSQAKNSILFFPVHGNEFSQQNPESQIKLFKEKYDPTKSSVSLYWVEYINPTIYNLYKSAGFKILCSGFSGQMEHTGLGYSARRLAGSPIGGRPSFILNTIAMLVAHKKIVFGGLGSPLFYAAYLEKEIDLLHKYLSTTYLDMDSEHGTTFEADPVMMRYVKFISESMNCEFEDINYSSAEFRRIANSELGLSDKLSTIELQRLLEPHIDNSANPQSLAVFKNSVSNFNNLLSFYN